MAFDGALLTRPTGATEQSISDALLLSYNGVYAAPPSSTTLSPNDDGVDDVETFTYKLVRPSTVTAVVQGPERATVTLAQEAQQPGIHTVQWDGKNVEGTWRFLVTAVDDTGRTTTADRQFSVNQTLGALQVGRQGKGLSATFTLAHPATVTVTVEKPNGIVVATLLSKKLETGAQTATWTGNAPAGYRVRVVASNTIGKATLVTALAARS
jgi:flagellar hook assembly protein FlgD